MKKQVPFEIELQEHNGCAGSNPVKPFAGRIFTKAAMKLLNIVHIPDGVILYEGREFTHAYDVEFDTNGFHVYRERVTTKPSKWALERA